jgi:hypothetical protein
MGDYPMITVRADDGHEFDLTRWGNERMYVPGLRIRLQFREDLVPADGVLAQEDWVHQQVVSVELEESGQRVSGIGPGLGAGQYRRLGYGTSVLYYWVPDEDDARRIADGMEEARATADIMGGGWVEIRTREPESVQSELNRAIRECGGAFDGGEVIREDADPLVFGPDGPI